MNTLTIIKRYDAPPICEREVLRYAGCRKPDEATSALLASCRAEAESKLTYAVCYRELPVMLGEEVCDFGVFSLRSKQLADNLRGCRSVILFAATVGVEPDRLIAKYGRLSPAKALLMQALGAERVEALCDRFCVDIAAEKKMGTRPRFSPGYGDLPLSAQKDIFMALECEKRIGLYLTDSLLMSPSKSVTAFVGLSNENKPTGHKCDICNKTDCAFRGVI